MIDSDDDQPISKGMSDAELCALIERESHNALGYDDLLADVRRTALEFYLGEAKGELAPPEIDGRSQVVSKDLMDAVEWIMPSAMRLFTGTDEVARFEPDGPEDEQGAKDATMLVQHVVMEQNPGFRVLHDAIKNCLIQRMAVVKVYCEDESEEKQERYEGLDPWQMEALTADKAVEIVSATPNPYDPQLVDVLCKRTHTSKKYRVEGVPPEEFGMSKEAKSLEDARYVEHKVKRTVSDLKGMGYDPDLIDGLFGDSARALGEEDQERHSLEQGWTGQDDDAADASQREITLTECYIRVDYDGDGVAEYRRVVKAGTEILENEVTDDHCFALFTPVLMPYRAIGLGMYDLIEDVQRIKTALTRQTLDSAYLANNTRMLVGEGVNLDDLLNPRPGGIVRTKDMANVRELKQEFVGQAGLEMINHFDAVRDARTGVTAFNQGVAGNALGGTAVGSNGAQDMMAASVQRIELMLRVIAETGVKRLWKLALKVLCQYQDKPMQLKINGRWLQLDPREWKNQYRVTISVGVAATSRQQQIGNLNNILMIQQQAMPVGLCTPQNMYATLSRLTEQMGYRDSEQFWSNPENNPPPPPPVPEAVQVEQLRQQGAQQQVQVKAQADIATERMKQEAQAAQAMQETQLEAQRNAIQMQQEKELEAFKIEKQAELERFKAELQRQTELDKARISQEGRLHEAGIAAGNILPSGEAPSPVHEAVKSLAEQVAALHEHAAKPRSKRVQVIRDANGQILGAQVDE